MMNDQRQPQRLERPPMEMLDFVRDVGRTDYHDRQARRHALIMEVAVFPVDEQLQPIVAPFVALTRDISTCGVSLVHTARIHAPRLRLKFECKDLSAIIHAKVLRCRRLRQYFEIGCEFVTRIDCGQCPNYESLSRQIVGTLDQVQPRSLT